MSEDRHLELLESIRAVQARFIELRDPDPGCVFDDLLARLVQLTDSTSGFLSELSTAGPGPPFLGSLAITRRPPFADLRRDAPLQAKTRMFREVEEPHWDAVRSAGHSMWNAPGDFLGRPLEYRGQLIGMVGLSGRPGGYEPALVEFIEPLIETAARICQAVRTDRETRAAEARLREHAERQETAALLGKAALPGVDTRAILEKACHLVVRSLGTAYCKITLFEREDRTPAFEQSCASEPTSPTLLLDVLPRSLSVPIRDPRGLLGSLEVRCEASREFHSHDLQLLQVVVEFLAAAVSRLRSDQLVAENELRLKQLTQAMDGVFWLVEREFRVLFVGANYAKVFGRDPEHLQQDPLDRLQSIHVEDRGSTLDAFQRAFLGETFDVEYRVVHPDGRIRWVHDRGYPITRPDGEVYRVAGIAEDITERREVHERLLQTQKLESVGVLAGGIAHDFNNLLQGVIGCTEEVLSSLPAGSNLHHHMTSILLSAEQATGLCRQLLAYAGPSRLNREAVDVSQLIQDMRQLLTISLSGSVALQSELDPGLPTVHADTTQLQQVVMNLVGNAAEAIRPGDPGVIRIATGVVEQRLDQPLDLDLPDRLEPGTYVRVEVTDSGTGIDDATRCRIFDPFFSTKFAGRGLGLAAVSGIVLSHRGGIHVTSEPGLGSTFRVYLPAPFAAAAVPAPPADPGNQALAGKCVLVVDDEQLIRDITCRALERRGIKALGAHDGQEGVELFRAHADRIDVVILDRTMPRMDGLEAFRQIRRARPDARIILTSGLSQEEATRRFHGMGLSGFLEKPFRMQQLVVMLRKVLAGEAALSLAEA